jgi:hypothetical protein
MVGRDVPQKKDAPELKGRPAYAEDSNSEPRTFRRNITPLTMHVVSKKDSNRN